PVAVTVQGVGAAARIDFPGDGKGNLGLVDFGVEFENPTGVGIAIDAGPVSGGGFISFKDGRYAGALELRVYEIAVKACAVLDTKLRDGRKGFSFVIVIAAESQPIQRGLGFTLNGVGGLLGINRTVSEEALEKALQSGRLADVLFPQDL